LAPAFVQALPTLATIPAHYNHEVNGELLYKLCAALTARGLGSAETWQACGKSAVAYAQHSILAAIGVERGDLLRRNLELRLEVSDVFSDGYTYGDQGVGDGKLCVTISCTGCGYLKMGPALDALEAEATGLGAAFYWSLLRSIYRVMRIYDHDDALMYEEMLRDHADQGDPENPGQYEFPEVKRSLPLCIERTLDAKQGSGCLQLLRTHAGSSFASWIGRLRTLERISRRRVQESRELIEGNYDGPPLPSWLIAFREHDAIAACFDEESQHMLESSAEPALCVVFSPDKPNQVEQAIRAVDRFVSFNAELCLLAEELGRWEASNGCGDRDRREPSLRAA
jgi:hypothetical protein